MIPHIYPAPNALGSWCVWLLVPFGGYAGHTLDKPEPDAHKGGWPWLLGISRSEREASK